MPNWGDRGKSPSYYEDLRAKLQALVDDSILTGAGTLTVALTSLAAFRDEN